MFCSASSRLRRRAYPRTRVFQLGDRQRREARSLGTWVSRRFPQGRGEAGEPSRFCGRVSNRLAGSQGQDAPRSRSGPPPFKRDFLQTPSRSGGNHNVANRHPREKGSMARRRLFRIREGLEGDPGQTKRLRAWGGDCRLDGPIGDVSESVSLSPAISLEFCRPWAKEEFLPFRIAGVNITQYHGNCCVLGVVAVTGLCPLPRWARGSRSGRNFMPSHRKHAASRYSP